MYYSNIAQPHPHPVAAYQNLPDNMSVAGRPATAGMAGAACETQQGQPYGPPSSSSPYSGAPQPMLNLAKVSRNHEAQTTPRRAADAAFQQAARQQAQTQAHAEAQQEQLLRQHQAAVAAGLAAAAAAAQQQHAVLKAGAASPRAVNVDATTEGIRLAGPSVQQYRLAVPGSQFQASQPTAKQHQQYQQQARYVVAPHSGRTSPRAAATAGFSSGQQSHPATARGPLGSRLPQVVGSSLQQQPATARLPASARQAGVSPYLQALPGTARRQHAGAAAESQAQAVAATGAFNLPPLQLGPPAASGRANNIQAERTQLAAAAAVQPPRGPPLQHMAEQPALPTTRGSGKDDVYSRLSQGLPTVETVRSARLQAARQAPQPHQAAPQQVHLPPSQPIACQVHRPLVQQQQCHGPSGAAQPGGSAVTMLAGGQRGRVLRMAAGAAGHAMQVDSPTSSTGLTPHAARLMDPSLCSPRHMSAGGKPQQPQAQVQQAQVQQAQLQQVQLWPMDQQQVQQQPTDAGHLLAAFGGTELAFAPAGVPVEAQDSVSAQQLRHGSFAAAPTSIVPVQQAALQTQLVQQGAVAALQPPSQPPPPPQQQPYQAPQQQYLYSQGSIAAHFAKLHSSVPLEAGGFPANMQGGSVAQKLAAMPQPGVHATDAIRAVRRRSDEVLHPVFGQQPQQQPQGMQAGYASQAAARQQVQPGTFGPGNALLQLPAGQPATTAEQANQQAPQTMQFQPYASMYTQQQQQQQWQQQQQQQQEHGALGLPVSMSDLDLVAAVAEEVSVYDLQRQQELEYQQTAAATASARRASLSAAQQMEAAQPSSQQGAAVGPAVRRLSYQPPGVGPALAAGVPPPPASSTGNRPPSAAAPTAVPTPSPPAEGERRPVTAATALRQWGHLLTAFEQSEVLSYQYVWFVGRPGTAKIKGDKCSSNPNWGYDDPRGDYLTVVGDHIGYRYEVLGTLGRGSFGQVLRCKDHRSGGDVALKIIRNKKRFQKQAAVEAAILALLREQDPDDTVNVVRTYESFTFRGHLCITFELLGINLYEYIKACNFQGSSLAVVRRVAQQVLVTLRFLLRLQVCHCDLKPENVLLKERGKTAVKVIDFGSSCYVDKRMYTYIQSRFYRSPEVILGLPYGPPIDMWSLGCILAELLTGQPIFPGEDEREQLACIMELLGPPPRALVEAAPRANLFFDTTTFVPLPCPPNSRGKTHRPSSRTMERALGGWDDAAFIDFLKRCLVWDPARRMTPDQALQHCWITGGSLAPSRLGSAASLAAPSSGGWRPSGSAGRDGRTGGVGSGLAALASGLLPGSARAAAQAGLL